MHLYKDMEKSDVLKAESFYGVYHLLTRDGADRNQDPIVLIIKNIKNFPMTVLNDLIHLVKKYRAAPFGLKLNLMIGVQNNSIDEFHMRIRIQNAVKMTVKKFTFPCMKNIIFEVIFWLIMNVESPVTFHADCFQRVIEVININGMSVNKFKRILRILATDFFLYHEFFFVHRDKLPLKSHKDFAEHAKALTDQLNSRFSVMSEPDKEQTLKFISMIDKQSAPKTIKEAVGYITGNVRSFCKQKRVWIKAVNVLIELMLLRLEDISPKERDIFKYEFTINFMSKRNLDEAFRYVKDKLGLIGHYETFIKQQVLPCLERKST